MIDIVLIKTWWYKKDVNPDIDCVYFTQYSNIEFLQQCVLFISQIVWILLINLEDSVCNSSRV